MRDCACATTARSQCTFFLDWYLNGHIVEQDVEESVRLLDLAIRGEYAPALYKRALQLIRINEPRNDCRGALNYSSRLRTRTSLAPCLLWLALKHTGVGVSNRIYMVRRSFIVS